MLALPWVYFMTHIHFQFLTINNQQNGVLKSAYVSAFGSSCFMLSLFQQNRIPTVIVTPFLLSRCRKHMSTRGMSCRTALYVSCVWTLWTSLYKNPCIWLTEAWSSSSWSVFCILGQGNTKVALQRLTNTAWAQRITENCESFSVITRDFNWTSFPGKCGKYYSRIQLLLFSVNWYSMYIFLHILSTIPILKNLYYRFLW